MLTCEVAEAYRVATREAPLLPPSCTLAMAPAISSSAVQESLTSGADTFTRASVSPTVMLQVGPGQLGNPLVKEAP